MYFGLDRAAALTLIWRTTHADFKGLIEGARYVLCLTNGATVSMPLDSLPHSEILARTEYGLRWLNRLKFADSGLLVHPRTGQSWAGAVHTDGTAYIVNLLTGAQELVAGPRVGAGDEERMTAAFLASERAADARAAELSHCALTVEA